MTAADRRAGRRRVSGLLLILIRWAGRARLYGPEESRRSRRRRCGVGACDGRGRRGRVAGAVHPPSAVATGPVDTPLHDPDVVADVLRDTFVAAWKGARRWRGDGEVAAWLWGIAVRRLVSRRRSRPHANATRCEVTISCAETLAIEIRDNGRASDAEGSAPAWRPGVGLTSMRERATPWGEPGAPDPPLPAAGSWPSFRSPCPAAPCRRPRTHPTKAARTRQRPRTRRTHGWPGAWDDRDQRPRWPLRNANRR
jgi:hypothetical protein